MASKSATHQSATRKKKRTTHLTSKKKIQKRSMRKAPTREDTNDLNIDFLSPQKGPELVFGLVGPIGTDMKLVSRVLGEELRKVDYKAIPIHVTDLLKDFDTDFGLEETPLEKRYATYIDAGNKFREQIDRKDAFALFAVAAIRNKRVTLTNDRNAPASRCAYILNQFKRPEEIETLRQIYGRGFIQVSAYCSKQKRLESLTKRISQSHYRDKRDDAYRGTAHDLIVRDDDEEDNPFGQRVRYAFPLADVVINADDETSIRVTCSRFI